MGQSPSPLSQIQCHPNPLPQGFHHVQQSWVASKRKGAPQESSHQNVTTPNGLWTRWSKGLTGLPDRPMMGATVKPSLLTMECKVRAMLSYPTHKVFVKVSKRSVVDMTSKLTSKVAEPSKTFWSPPRTKTQWSTKVVPSIGTSWGPRLWWWVHRGNLQDLWWKIQRTPEGPLCHSSP